MLFFVIRIDAVIAITKARSFVVLMFFRVLSADWTPKEILRH